MKEKYSNYCSVYRALLASKTETRVLSLVRAVQKNWIIFERHISSLALHSQLRLGLDFG